MVWALTGYDDHLYLLPGVVFPGHAEHRHEVLLHAWVELLVRIDNEAAEAVDGLDKIELGEGGAEGAHSIPCSLQLPPNSPPKLWCLGHRP